MPTARPSMTPSTGVTDSMSTVPDRAREARTPTPTPMIALMSGRLAPISVPSMMNSTIAATITPPISPGPRISGMLCAMSLETSTSTPSMFAFFISSTTAVFTSAYT